MPKRTPLKSLEKAQIATDKKARLAWDTAESDATNKGPR